MTEYIEITDRDTELTVGKYRYIFDCLIFPNQIADFMNSIKGLLNKTYEVFKGKRIYINNIESMTIEEDTKIIIDFEILENPIPVMIIAGVIVGLLGLGGLLLTLHKVQKIVESPAGAGIGVGIGSFGVLILVGGVAFLLSNLEKLKL